MSPDSAAGVCATASGLLAVHAPIKPLSSSVENTWYDAFLIVAVVLATIVAVVVILGISERKSQPHFFLGVLNSRKTGTEKTRTCHLNHQSSLRSFEIEKGNDIPVLKMSTWCKHV